MSIDNIIRAQDVGHFTFAYKIESGRANFKIYEAISGPDLTAPGVADYPLVGYPLAGSMGAAGEETEDLGDAQILVSATVRFDGEMEFTIHPEEGDVKGWHHILPGEGIKFGQMLEEIFNICRANMPNWCGD